MFDFCIDDSGCGPHNTTNDTSGYCIIFGLTTSIMSPCTRMAGTTIVVVVVAVVVGIGVSTVAVVFVVAVLLFRKIESVISYFSVWIRSCRHTNTYEWYWLNKSSLR